MGEIVLASFLQYVLSVVMAVITPFLSYYLVKLAKKMEWDAAIPAIENAVNEAADTLVEKANRENWGRNLNYDIENELLADSVNYVLGQVPKAMRDAKVTPTQIENKLRAKLSQKNLGK